jgi:hypothetical protein
MYKYLACGNFCFFGEFIPFVETLWSSLRFSVFRKVQLGSLAT